MLLYSKSHSNEKRSEYAGRCTECNASLYWKDGKLIPNCRVEDGHLCKLQEEKEGKNN